MGDEPVCLLTFAVLEFIGCHSTETLKCFAEVAGIIESKLLWDFGDSQIGFYNLYFGNIDLDFIYKFGGTQI